MHEHGSNVIVSLGGGALSVLELKFGSVDIGGSVEDGLAIGSPLLGESIGIQVPIELENGTLVLPLLSD